MITDDDLTRLLGGAAATFDVPDQQPVLDKLAQGRSPRHLPQGRWMVAAAAVVAILGALLYAGQGPQGTADQSSVATAPVQNAAAGVGAAPQFGTQGGALSRSAAALPVPAAASGAGGTAPLAPTVADSAKVVKTGTITLLADKGKVSDLVISVRGLVTGAGGYVSDSTSQELSANPSATLTMRIPVAAFDDVIGKVRGLGAKVVSVDSQGKDVTATYADTEAQIASLKAARSRFLSILAGARTIGDTLSVQQRVDDVQGQIDRLEGQRRLLADQSSLATLTVTVGVKAPLQEQSRQGGLSSAWDRAQHGFSTGVEGIVARSGRALVVLIVLGVLLLLGRVAWRLARRRLV